MKESFRKFAHVTALWTGSPAAFAIACLTVFLWALTGPHFNYSDTWQLVINTGTSVATFLMVFLIQATQNRDSREFQIKLDELIRATKDARNHLINLEGLSDAELDTLHKDLCAAHELDQKRLKMIDEHRRQRSARVKQTT